jgi:hypothetical protein
MVFHRSIMLGLRAGGGAVRRGGPVLDMGADFLNARRCCSAWALSCCCSRSCSRHADGGGALRATRAIARSWAGWLLWTYTGVIGVVGGARGPATPTTDHGAVRRDAYLALLRGGPRVLLLVVLVGASHRRAAEESATAAPAGALAEPAARRGRHRPAGRDPCPPSRRYLPGGFGGDPHAPHRALRAHGHGADPQRPASAPWLPGAGRVRPRRAVQSSDPGGGGGPSRWPSTAHFTTSGSIDITRLDSLRD